MELKKILTSAIGPVTSRKITSRQVVVDENQIKQRDYGLCGHPDTLYLQLSRVNSWFA